MFNRLLPSRLRKAGDKTPNDGHRIPNGLTAPQAPVVDERSQDAKKSKGNRLKPFSRLNPRQQTSPQSVVFTSEDLYACKDLMRTKYALDVDVSVMRKARRRDIPLRDEKQRMAKGAMDEILRRAKEWDKDSTWTPEERDLVTEIQMRLGLVPEPPVVGDSSSAFERVSDVSY